MLQLRAIDAGVDLLRAVDASCVSACATSARVTTPAV